MMYGVAVVACGVVWKIDIDVLRDGFQHEMYQ